MENNFFGCLDDAWHAPAARGRLRVKLLRMRLSRQGYITFARAFQNSRELTMTI
jgi:hypothetical protein